MSRDIVLKYWKIIRYKTLIIQCVPEGTPIKRFCYESSVGNPLVIFTWVPLANIFILLAGFIIFFINLMSNIKIR